MTAKLVKPLRKKITVTYEGVRYQLSAEKLEIDSDVDGMVDRALEESQEGGLPTRVWRYATGGEVDVAIAPAGQLLQRGDRRVHRARSRPRSTPTRSNATIQPTTVSLDGRRRAMTGSPSTSRSCAAGSSPWSSVRTIARSAVPVDVGPPRGDQGRPRRAVPDLPDRRPVELHGDAVEGPEAGEEVHGRGRPAGVPDPDRALLDRVSKQVDPVWSVPNSPWAGELGGTTVAGGTAENPLKARWMGVTDGAGFHGTDDVGSLGTAASHGCIRMSVPDVIELYDQVPVGTPVYIG